MPVLVSHTDQPITAATGHTVPPYGKLSVSDEVLARIGDEGYISGQMKRGALTIEADPTPAEEQGITRPWIAKAKRADLVAVITEHSDYTEADLEGVTVDGRDGEDGLRDMAVRLVLKED